MDRSKTDRLLEDWDMVTAHVERPPEPPRPSTVRILMAPAAALAVVAVIVAIVATGPWLGPPDQGIPVAGGSPSPTAPATPGESPGQSTAANPAGSPSPAPSADLGPFACVFPVVLPGTAAGTTQAQPITVRIGTHLGYERIVFEYGDATRPTLTIEPVSAPLVHDPSGLPMTVDGPWFLQIRLDGVAIGYSGPTDLRGAGHIVNEVARQGDFEGVQTWIVGSDRSVCVRVLTLTGPTRLAVDLAL